MNFVRFPSFVLLLFLIFSCQRTTEEKLVPASYCGTENPLEDLDWLNEIKTTMEMSAIAVGGQIIAWTYYGETVFWIDECYSCEDKIIEIYDCAGNKVCEFGGIGGWDTCGDFQENASDSTMLFNHTQTK